eukprot:4526239-Pleurochrysis_carterae.AAC.1
MRGERLAATSCYAWWLSVNPPPPMTTKTFNLSACSALELRRFDSMVTPPRGLHLVIGCIGMILDLTDTLPSWDGCKALLRGERIDKAPPKSQHPSESRRPLVQHMSEFEVENVSEAAVERVMSAELADVGGLMDPTHLVNVNQAAVILAEWLQ